jgi:nicotinate-nucleotide adenylyltransferase
MGSSRRIGIFPGSFNPPTNAHIALIRAAAGHVDEVIAVLPRTFPHKIYDGATLEQRIAMLEAIQPAKNFSVQVTDGGLFIEIARECREVHGAESDLWFLCGRDAAERILEWDYGDPAAVHSMMDQFGLLVAARGGELIAPSEIAHRIHSLDVPVHIEEISSSEVRRRVRSNHDWEHLVPAEIANMVREIYRG